MNVMGDRFLKATTPLSNLTAVVARMARARTAEQVIDIVRATARSLIGCQGITYVKMAGEYCHYVEEDAVGPLWKGSQFPAATCVSGWAMINRQTAVIPDIYNDPRVPHELYEQTFVRSLAMAPIGTDNPVGAIGAYWDRAYNPSAWEVETLEALASAAASAIENIEYARSISRGRIVDDHEADNATVDVARVAAIPAVPLILEIVLRMTGLGFAAVARVTEDKWVACQVLDHVSFGLAPGGELPITSTICNEIRDHRKAVVINDVATDPVYRDHHTPRIYGLRSYISVPIILADGSFFGTLCAIGTKAAQVNDPHVIGTFELFADLIARHLDDETRLEASKGSLLEEQELSKTREQFLAVLGHDLRNPIAALDAGIGQLRKRGWTDRSPAMLDLMQGSVSRMSLLVADVMDLARARLGEGFVVERSLGDLPATISQVVDELRSIHPNRVITTQFDVPKQVVVDHPRVAQLVSNLVANALVHGHTDTPVMVSAKTAGENLEISVANEGDPIAPDKLATLFSPFKRGTSTGHGLGLGLYIALEIAKSHGGTINVVSQGADTVFTFSMPLN